MHIMVISYTNEMGLPLVKGDVEAQSMTTSLIYALNNRRARGYLVTALV